MEEKKHDPLSDAFNTTYERIDLSSQIEASTNSDNEIVITDKTTEIMADYEFSRDTIKTTLLHAEDRLTEIMEIAQQSASPKAYEVVFDGMKTIISGSRDLLGLSEQFKNIVNKKEKDKTEVNNNNLFIGSTEALNAMLSKMGVTSGIRTINNNNNKDE